MTAPRCEPCSLGNHTGTNGTPGCEAGACSCPCQRPTTCGIHGEPVVGLRCAACDAAHHSCAPSVWIVNAYDHAITCPSCGATIPAGVQPPGATEEQAAVVSHAAARDLVAAQVQEEARARADGLPVVEPGLCYHRDHCGATAASPCTAPRFRRPANPS